MVQPCTSLKFDLLCLIWESDMIVLNEIRLFIKNKGKRHKIISAYVREDC